VSLRENRRFIPAKLLLENFMASGVGIGGPGEKKIDAKTASFIRELNAGLRRILAEEYELYI
jgi:hypothetical protein